MNKRVFIVHGWDGSPQNDWMPWAKKTFEKKGFNVHVPAMPDSPNPKIETWVPFLAKKVGEPDGNTILIGHSIGAQTILRYLETLPEKKKIDKVIFIAGWQTLTPEATPTKEDIEIARTWVETPINFEYVKGKANSFICVFSDNDPDVPYEENAKIYKEKLKAKIILVKNKGHFSQDAGVTKLPLLLELI